MKIKITMLSMSFILISAFSFAQKKDDPESIIENKVMIKKYHSTEELQNMQKGELLGLYLERVTVLTHSLPYIAFATKPGVTMSSLGIPNTKDNRKVLENEHENTNTYIENTTEFQNIMLPYSDTNKLTSAILFYENIMKSLHSYDEFN